ncbi:MAG: histone deacetylase [Phycisphaerae bacterium]
MRISFCSDYAVELPPHHRFPMRKFSALFELLCAERVVTPRDIMNPRQADWADLRLVHTPEYLAALERGALSAAQLRRLGFPWSPALVRRSRAAAQGTINAGRAALRDGIAGNLGGGTHHAFPDRGEGFCVLNDVAVAIRVLQRDGDIRRALVVDLDVHQGNGTAAIFADDSSVYTFSVHAERNYPFHKIASRRDVALPEGAGDDMYLAALDANLPDAIRESRPDLVFYLAGVDPVAGDRLGRLALTRAGLHARERSVLKALRDANLPIAIVLAGGYAPTPEQTAELHAVAHREAASLFR